MDIRNGRIYSSIESVSTETSKFCEEILNPINQKQKFRGKIKRNDPCPCGSGHKFKKCCLGKFK